MYEKYGRFEHVLVKIIAVKNGYNDRKKWKMREGASRVFIEIYKNLGEKYENCEHYAVVADSIRHEICLFHGKLLKW